MASDQNEFFEEKKDISSKSADQFSKQNNENLELKNPHIPVLIGKIIEILESDKNFCDKAEKDELCFLDATFGNGGYSEQLLNKFPKSKLIALDRDEHVMSRAAEFSKIYGDRFIFVHEKFSNVGDVLKKLNIKKIDAAFADIGVSSMQLDQKERGFSFNFQNKLDMRMGLCDFSAFDVVNKFSGNEIEKILHDYGDESRYKIITRRILEYRKKKQIETTLELANIVKSTYWNYSKIHPATKTFQAIRIFVNKELEELEKFVKIIVKYLNSDGMLFVVSFHSVEDRIVKHFFKSLPKNEFETLFKKPIVPDENELKVNVRARSAKLRVVRRINNF